MNWIVSHFLYILLIQKGRQYNAHILLFGKKKFSPKLYVTPFVFIVVALVQVWTGVSVRRQGERKTDCCPVRLALKASEWTFEMYIFFCFYCLFYPNFGSPAFYANQSAGKCYNCDTLCRRFMLHLPLKTNQKKPELQLAGILRVRFNYPSLCSALTDQ